MSFYQFGWYLSIIIILVIILTFICFFIYTQNYIDKYVADGGSWDGPWFSATTLEEERRQGTLLGGGK